MAEKEIEGIVCRFAVHIPTTSPDVPDVHLIKETVKYKDGTIEPRIRSRKDYKRPFGVTLRPHRNHKDKKEWEELDKLHIYHSTQSDLKRQCANAVGHRLRPRDTLKDVTTSPYIYGTNISSTSLIKKEYLDKYPDFVLPASVCAFDIETDMIGDRKEIIMVTAIMGNESVTVILKSFLEGYSRPMEQLIDCFNENLKEYIEAHGLTAEFILVDDEVQMMREIFGRIHAWKPDFLEIWNMDFDIPKIMNRLTELGVDPAEILCDPKVPPQLRLCKYKQGQSKKVTAAGKTIPINPASRWHTLFCTSSYYVIDGMCVYKLIRQQSEQEQTSYALDYILQKEKLPGKLKFKHLDGLDFSNSEKWHILMQSRYPFEYAIYNIFDCFAMLLLDKKTKDLCYTLPSYAYVTDYDRFNSQPTRIADAFHFDILESNHMLRSTGRVQKTNLDLRTDEDIEEEKRLEAERDFEETDQEVREYLEGEVIVEGDRVEFEAKTLDLRNWVLTLPSHYSAPGLKINEDDPTINTLYRGHVFDSDEVGAYPSATEAGNVSKGTTKREVITIEGIPERTFRLQNLNLVLGVCNSIEYSTTMFKAPKPEDMLESFKSSLY